MKIGISGASGKLGTAVVAELKARVPAGDIVAISRTPEKLVALGIHARIGDFNAPASLDAAYAGLDRLLIIPSSDVRPAVRGTQCHTAIERASAAGVGHITIMSTLGTRFAEPTHHLWSDYFVMEQAVMRTAREWTILRMAYYAELLADEIDTDQPEAVHTSITSTPVNFVSHDDVAAAAAAVLTGEGHHGAIYQLTGPVALDGNARAAAIARALGRPVKFAQITPQQYAEGLKSFGVPPHIVDAILSVQDMWAVGGFNVTTGDVERLAGRPPQDLESALKAVFRT